MREFTTILCLRHEAGDETDAIAARFALLEAAEWLGFVAVGANTTDDPTDTAIRMVMGTSDGEL